MKGRYDQNVFTPAQVLIIMGLLLIIPGWSASCGAGRTSQVTATINTCDTTRLELHTDTVAAIVAGHGIEQDSAMLADHFAGSLRIERDTAGLPVSYQWDARILKQRAGTHSFELSAISGGYTSGNFTSTATASTEVVEKTKESRAHVGPGIDQRVGMCLMVFVILYVIYVCIENVWRGRNK